MFIVKLYLESKMSCSKISKYFFLPYSSVNRIIEAYDVDSVASFGKLDKGINKIDSISIIHKLMQNYWSNQKSCYKTKDVIKYFNENTSIPIKENFVRNHMKWSLDLLFKKASSRPSQIDLEKHKVMKMAFIMEFSNLSAPDKLLISHDDVNFSYLTTYNRTWLTKGRSSYAKFF